MQRLETEGASTSKPLTVLCWNVLYKNFDCCGGSSSARAQLADEIAKADVAGLQECMNEDEIQSALGSRMSKAPNTDTFNCIFYKKGSVDFGGISGRQYLGDDARDSYTKRYFSWAKLSHEGRPFWLFSSHWCLDGPCGGAAGGRRHKLSAERILQKRKELGAEGLPTIITVDANSHMDGYDRDDGVRWFLANGFEIAGKGPMAGGIDYMFVSKGHWGVGEHKVGPTRPSDHPSFTVQLTLSGPPRLGAPTAPPPQAQRPAEQPSLSCSPFDDWPHVDAGVTCGNCKALVLTAPLGGRCDRYCESFGHTCVAAAEEMGETCDVLSEHRCDEEIPSTSDMLCTCARSESAGSAATPAPSAGPPAQPAATPAPSVGPPARPTLACRSPAQWPDVDGGVTCDDCTALVLTSPYGGRCDKYCESFGHVCVGAAEEVGETCEVKFSSPCDVEIAMTSDMLCSCHSPDSSAPPRPTGAPAPTPASTVAPTPARVPPVEEPLSCCSPYGEWPQVDGGVTCDACMALVLAAPYGGRCDKYCESFGHVCVAAAEEMNEDCTVKYTADCDVEISGTSDMLCTCHLPRSAGACPAPPVTVAPTPSPTTAPTRAPSSPAPPRGSQRIEVRGRQVLVDGRPLHLKGVAWNPIKKGGRHPSGLDFAEAVAEDAELLAKAGVNAIRTYEAITDVNVLDVLWSKGIWVLNSVYSFGGQPASRVVDRVNAVKDHPAILMWTIGNEWNYNGLYVGMSFGDSLSRLQEAAALIKQHDSAHPVACIYGELSGLKDAASRLSDVDVWGINVYRGISFGDLFDVYAGLSSKPMFLGEYGADAWNAKINREDQQSQAEATRALTEEMVARSSVTGGACLGGFVFEFADEWWKDGDGSASRHDIGGDAPGGGPYPDKTFNEEWWGLVDIDRKPRLAFDALRDVAMPAVAAI